MLKKWIVSKLIANSVFYNAIKQLMRLALFMCDKTRTGNMKIETARLVLKRQCD